MSFKDFIDDARILNTLEKLGFTAPTPIQAQAIPEILKGADLRASAQTGTGKTAAFLLPALIRLSQSKRRSGPRVIILVPTRELAIQLAEETAKLGNSLDLITVTLYGGVPYPKQFRQLSKPYDILIATPGRLIDHIEQNRVNLNNIEMFILDEADRMLDMGFIGPVEKIASKMPASRQTLMFSATFGKNMRKLSASLLRNPSEIATDFNETRSEQIEQSFYRTDSLADKQRCLEKLIAETAIAQVIVFSATKFQAQKIADRLCDSGLAAGALHGDMNQRQRTRMIDQFRSNKIQILVATDVAARGIDVLTISHVINFDLPNTLEDYIHRIGRTGRAGNKGVAFSFYSPKDHQMRRQIEKFSGIAPSLEAHPASQERPAPRGPGPRGPRRPFKPGKRPFRPAGKRPFQR